MVKIIALHQFDSPSAYFLDQTPMAWSRLEQLVSERPETFLFRPPEAKEVEEDAVPPMATAWLRQNDDGNVEIWKHRYDTT